MGELRDTVVPPVPAEVAEVFDRMPETVRDRLLGIRALVFEVAAARPEVGRIAECLKWGQPAYLTPESRSGTTLRLGLGKGGAAAVFTHCQTRVVPEFRAIFPDAFAYDGNRGVLLPAGDALDEAALRMLIGRALTYHLR
ncbi:DUF1801 domain-containing protein [Sulfitobacter sp. D35]|uniref:DUF1801 domain-containing protein n=1 Tax=Sulfitobacter sp. D35 TaxID=3083252 RepID=UPI00296F6B4D|nr:DUF1801 domain-containing protein [Sulfitobacter sp. D35]MDW4499276.1 DUF1801 domain-containing protein [Sulfitobacter sp. D35]